MKFKGDIIITDPCYVVDQEDIRNISFQNPKAMATLGFHNYMCRDTIYGDWRCTTYNTDTGEKIGGFCADCGLVAVFLLDEVHKYNPDFDWYVTRPWTTTLINNFDGEVNFEVRHHEGVWETDGVRHKKGDKWEDDEVVVIGKGNVNFIGKQTGF